MALDVEILCKVPTEVASLVPIMTQIPGVTNVDKFLYSHSVTIKPRNFILIPPFLLKPIQNSIFKSNGDSEMVLIVT